MLVFDHAQLRALRIERGWSLEDAARAYGISYPMARKLESADVRPSVGTLGRIADALGVGMNSLFCEGADERRDYPTDLGAEVDAWIEQTLAKAPPLSEEQARRISAILFSRAA